MTDKRKPTYDLARFQVWARSSRFRATGSALRGAAALGFGAEGMIDVIQTMNRKHFRKSMTSYADHKDWQDVYVVPSDAGDVYVKFRADVVVEFLLLSFKEKDQ